MSGRKVALLAATVALVAAGVVAFGFTGAAYASVTPSISTSQQPSSTTVGGSIQDQATVTGPAAYNCPPQDEAGFPLGDSSNSGGVLFCSYPAFPGENPNDFFCNYNSSSGVLTQDNDAGFCPATAVQTGGSGATPTGTVTFNLYNNPNGTGTPLFTDSNVSLSGGSATSAGYTTTGVGTDYWVATYNGDTNYNAVSSSTSGEPVTISPATPSINTSQQPASATVGTSIADQATVSGGDSPTGTVTFNLYDNPNGNGPALFTDTESLSGGSATSAGYTTTATGTDYWVATYNGDSNNNLVSSANSAEPVVISPATPSISTSQQPASGSVGGSIADVATVSGGDSPTGTVTFNLYDNPNGTGTPLFADTENLSGGAATSADYTPTAIGTDYWVATYNGDSNNSSVTSGTADEPVTIGTPTPSINTSQQPASASVGSSIADQATVSGGDSPTGTVTFNLYDNPNGTGTPLFTDTESLSNGSATSAGYTATAAGTDYWVATYNGDSNNGSVSSGTADEPVSITPVTPSISTTQQPSSATVGGTIADQATVSGGDSPTGTVTFNLYDNPNGTGTPLFTDTESLSNGSATSASFTTTATGTDYWVATYNGDSNNDSVSSGTADEPVTIGAASPSISTTQQPSSASVGSSIADQATVSGGQSPTGTVTFNLYDNPNGTGTPLFTDTEPLSNGSATSAGFTTTATGTDYWVATYNGDSNNNSVTSGTSDEPVTITGQTPTIGTSQQPTSATVGSSIADQATVTGAAGPGFSCPPQDELGFPLGQNSNSGGVLFCSYPAVPNENPNDFFCTYNANTGALTQDNDAGLCPGTAAGSAGGPTPSGTVTFNLYDNPNGTGTPLFTDTESLSNGSATSAGYTATATGTDYWVATYNGDSTYGSVSSGNSDEPVTINSATPSISTSQQPASATAGSSIADQATVSGGDSPTGTVTFNLYDNPNGTGTPLFSDTESLSGGSATSAGFTTTATGTDYWVATYNGDSNNNSVTSTTDAEPVTIGAASPSISTSQQPASAHIGGSIADKATVSGGENPTGTVTFNLYNNPNGTGTPLFTDTESLSGGSATSKGFTTTATGTDYWVATYNGDSNNNSVTSVTDAEPVMISAAAPTISTSQQPASASVGSSIADQATLSGGNSPTGTVTFKLYRNSFGTGTPLFSDTESLSGGSATSAGYTPTKTGTDYWVATYNGDNNNGSVSSGTSDEPVTINPASPTLGPVKAPASGKQGSQIARSSISAHLAGGFSPTGTVTFKVFGPRTSAPSNCSGGTTVGTATASGDGTDHPSKGFTPSQLGDYWWYATYAGDSSNNAAHSVCGKGMTETVVSAVPVVYAGYVDTARDGKVTAPSPWQGSAGVIFEGCNYFKPDRCPKTKSGADRYDAGAIRIDNTTGAPLKITNASVVVAYCTYHPWPGLKVTLPPGKQLILTETGGKPPCNNTDPDDNFDTSDTPHSYKTCTKDHAIGVLDVTINGAATSFNDPLQILNTGGADLGSKACGSRNEAHPWGKMASP
jgi:hypothetical protein